VQDAHFKQISGKLSKDGIMDLSSKSWKWAYPCSDCWQKKNQHSGCDHSTLAVGLVNFFLLPIGEKPPATSQRRSRKRQRERKQTRQRPFPWGTWTEKKSLIAAARSLAVNQELTPRSKTGGGEPA
jgi:hypothetical protein